jgi:hypothetical protein
MHPDKFCKGGIHLTQVTTRCSVYSHGGLPPDAYRIRGALFDRGCVPSIRLPASVAGRIRLPSVRGWQGLAVRERLGSLRWLRLSGFRDSGDDFREHSQAVDAVVSGYLVADVSQDGRQRFGVAEGSWPGELQDRVDVAAQVAPRNGAARTRSIVWTSGG